MPTPTIAHTDIPSVANMAEIEREALAWYQCKSCAAKAGRR